MAVAPDANDPQDIDPSSSTVPAPPLSAPTIHEAELAPGPSGVVHWGVEINLAAALDHRRMGLNVVVRGDDLRANRRLAEEIERFVGPYRRQEPHRRRAGPWALPHFQQEKRDPPPPGGHTFYETPNRKAHKRT